MRFLLTSADLDAMPPTLKRDLLAYFASGSSGTSAGASVEEPSADGLAVLSRQQVVALVRDLSFGRRLRRSRDLLEALAYDDPGSAPTPERLLVAAGAKDTRQLHRELDRLQRLIQLVTHDPAAELTRPSKEDGTFVVHPLTRAVLRDVFAQLGRSGAGEEPAWA